MNIIGLKKEDVKDKKIISIKTYNEIINFNLSTNFDIILLGLNEIKPYDIFIDKVETINDCIMCISFPASLIIKRNRDSTVKQYNHDFLVSHSFCYASNSGDFNIYPISLNFKILNNKIHVCITYAYFEASLNHNIHSNEFFSSSKNEAIDDKISTFSDFSYIDISKEFI